MPDYQILYEMLFRTVEQAVAELDAQNFDKAGDLLSRSLEDGRRACFPDAEKDGLYPCFYHPALTPREKK